MATERSKKIVSGLIRNAFHNLSDVEVMYGAEEVLIETAKDFELIELIEELKLTY